MGDRLGTPGVVDFRFFSQIIMMAIVAATSKVGSNLKTFHRNCRRSQIKKSKLILVTAFKVGFHFFSSDFGFRYLGGRVFKLQRKHCREHCIANIALHPKILFFTAKLRKIGSTPRHREFLLSTAIPR